MCFIDHHDSFDEIHNFKVTGKCIKELYFNTLSKLCITGDHFPVLVDGDVRIN